MMFTESKMRRKGLAGQADNIVGGNIIKSAEQKKIVNFEFSASVFDMAVALLGFIEDSADIRLGEVPVFTEGTQPLTIIQSHHLNREKYHTQYVSIDFYSKIEYYYDASI